MHRKERKIFGVIAASAADIEQREILSGAIGQAQKMDIDIAVISNIYNPTESTEVLRTENEIYDLILSDEFDGFILISEAIINPDAQPKVIEALEHRAGAPVLVVGTPTPGLMMPDFHFINTSDENDIEDITDHLIDVHGFEDIHILTGQVFIEASHKRVAGYRRSLEKHGIQFGKQKVFFGDFWLNSGRDQARKYITGELPYPQALICCNDYMAYGLLDEFMENDIDISEKMAVIGYEYIRERRNHSPLLTTYQRNRRDIGAEAVRMLDERLVTGRFGSFDPPRGRLIHGDTCGCGAKREDIKRELLDVRTKATYDFLNLFSQLEHRLTECRNIDEFVQRCWEYQFMIRNVSKLHMCLYENWFDDSENTGNLISYNLLTYEKPLIFPANEISVTFSGSAAPYYFCPLFFGNRSLGYVVLSFNEPDTFDHIFRNWLKSISNGLEFLRMKNDIRYLTQCQSIAEHRDTLTGMLNEKGLRSTYKSDGAPDLFFLELRICLFSDSFIAINENEKILSVLDAAEAVRKFCGNSNVCGKLSDDTFVCFVHSSSDADLLADRLTSIMYRHSVYMERYGVDSFVCAAVKCSGMSYHQAKLKCAELLDAQIHEISSRRPDPHYKELQTIRDYIYASPAETFDSDRIYAHFDGSTGYFRSIFRKCFGITIHSDCTRARMAAVKYYLSVTTMSIAEIAAVCGYSDAKYLMRQFQQQTGMTAAQYRTLGK